MIEGNILLQMIEVIEPDETGEAITVRKVQLRITQSNFGFDANLDPIDAYAFGQALINTACVAMPSLKDEG